MGLNRMMMKNGNPRDVFIAYIDRTIRQFEDNVLTTVGDDAFFSCRSLKEIHFAAKNKEAIEALSDYSNKFGATNATIYFDI